MPRHPPTDTNPWGLTASQVAVMDALIEHGCRKLAAYHLNMAIRTVDDHLRYATRKMGARTMVQRVLIWDRWRRAVAFTVHSETELGSDAT
jgi:FixJ family two-component response regulator